MDASEVWGALRVALSDSGHGVPEYPVTTRFLLALALVRKAIATLPSGERLWASWCYSRRSYLTAFEGWKLPEPETVIDLGCGDGFLTCFYGRLYPRAEVLGLDCLPEAVASARALATILGVDNVTFIEGDAENLDAIVADRTFGLVTARCAFRGFVGVDRAWPGERLDDVPAEKAYKIAAAIRRVLLPHGLFVSTGRWDAAAQLRSWAAVLCASGFAIDLNTSRAARVGDPDSRALYVMLAARIGADTRPPSLEEAQAFLVGAELKTGPNLAVHYGHAAQALFELLTPRRLLYGYEAKYPNGSAWRRELWAAGPLVVSFDYTNGDDRELRFWSRMAEGSLRSTLENEVENLTANGWGVIVYPERTPPRI
jgi:SAM-dependent methyltransferase